MYLLSERNCGNTSKSNLSSGRIWEAGASLGTVRYFRRSIRSKAVASYRRAICFFFYNTQNTPRAKTGTKSSPVLKLVDVVHHLLRAVPGVVFVFLLYENKNRLCHLAVSATNEFERCERECVMWMPSSHNER